MDTLKIIGNIRILGTIHISSDSAGIVKKIIEEWRPDVVLLELDKIRLNQLIELNESKEFSDSDENEMFSNKSKGKYNSRKFSILEGFHYIQQDISATIGINVGTEMISAYKVCSSLDINIIPIDIPIDELSKDLEIYISEETKKEIQKDFEDSASNGKINELYNEFLGEIQTSEGLKNIIDEFQIEYPELHEILINRRNNYMSGQIIEYIKRNPNNKVLVVVGMGHLNKIFDILKQNI